MSQGAADRGKSVEMAALKRLMLNQVLADNALILRMRASRRCHAHVI